MNNPIKQLNKTYRIVQLTDLHFTLYPTLQSLFPLSLNAKRILGILSLSLGRRYTRFDTTVQQYIVNHVKELNPDLCIISGDISSTALHSEYKLAQVLLHPLLHSTVPTLIIPGNHDAYTKQSEQEWTIQQYFDKYMNGIDVDTTNNTTTPNTLYRQNTTCTGITVSTIDSQINIITLNPCRYAGIRSNGYYPKQQLQDLQNLLNDKQLTLTNKYNIIVTHYPVLDRKTNTDYGKSHYNHGVVNNHELIEILQNAHIKPNLIIHGHVHRGYYSELQYKNNQHTYAPIYNPGSSGQKFVPCKRTAAFNIYNITNTGDDSTYHSHKTSHIHQQDVWNMRVDRYYYNGKQAVVEPTPYTTEY